MKRNQEILDLNKRLFLYKFDNRRRLKCGPIHNVSGLLNNIKDIVKKLLKKFGCLKISVSITNNID